MGDKSAPTVDNEKGKYVARFFELGKRLLSQALKVICGTLRLDEEREESFLDSRRDLRSPGTRPRRTPGKLAGAHVSGARLTAEEESVEAIDLEREVDLALRHKR